MDNGKLICPRCGGGKLVKAGINRDGKQIYLCKEKDCRHYTVNPLKQDPLMALLTTDPKDNKLKMLLRSSGVTASTAQKVVEEIQASAGPGRAEI